jgi:hypothetical protein
LNLEKVVFGFFVLLAATLNFGFFIGDLGDPRLHNPYELYSAVVVNLIATVLKFGDRTQIALRRRAAGEHRLGRAAGRRDRVVPPPLTSGGAP